MRNIIYIYTTQVTSRLKYTLEFVFQSVLRLDYELTTDSHSCDLSSQPFINYSESPCGNGLWIKPIGLLQEEGLKSVDLQLGQWDDLLTLFSNNTQAIPFDIFSAIFYLISRYEEYNSTALDRFGRFKHEESVAFKNGFLQRPLVDEWIYKLKEMLSSRYPQLDIGSSYYSVHSTIDVDQVYRFLGNMKVKMLAKFVLLLAKFNFEEAKKMLKVMTYREADPYYQFDYIQNTHRAVKCKYSIFVHCGGKHRYDEMNFYPLPVFRNYLRKENHSCIIGLHPSYGSSFNEKGIVREKKILEHYLRYPATTSRHHYLRVRVPESYRLLNKIGMLHDYTMGYAGMYGFRASTCHSFRFFDVEANKMSRIRIHNTIIMDGTLRFYLKLSPEEAIERVKFLIDQCKAVKGEFIMLWHNNSVSDQYEWKGWRRVFEELLVYSKKG